MNLESDKRLKFQASLDFSSAPTGEARQAGWENAWIATQREPLSRPEAIRRLVELGLKANPSARTRPK